MHGKLIVLVAVIALVSSQSLPGLDSLPSGLGGLPTGLGGLETFENISDTALYPLIELISQILGVLSSLLGVVINIVVTLLSAIFQSTTTTVNIPGQGDVKGLVKKFETDSSNVYYQYKGIPYAEPAKRFTVAEAKKPWSGVHDGTVEGKVCPQFTGGLFYTGAISEDCLVLTVTTPVNPENYTGNPLPVLVFVHGGFYALGSSRTSWYDPELMTQEGVVVVNLQYRLSVYGFVTDGNIIPKNIGLKDVRLALQWVQSNIGAFGGDPQKVTIQGESAGAMQVSAIYQSESTKNLCQHIIMQSGNVISPFSVNKDPIKAFRKIISSTRCAGTLLLSVQAQYNCMKSLTMEELNTVAGMLMVLYDIGNAALINGAVAALVMEDANDTDAIIVDKPIDQVTNGVIPADKSVMVSITSEEMFTFEGALNVLRFKENSGLVPLGMNATDPNAVGKMIKERYAGSEAGWSIAPASTYTSYGSDLIFNIPSRYFAEKAAPVLNTDVGVYFLQFSYTSTIGVFNDGQHKVGHADDVLYTWKTAAISFESTRQYSFSPEAIRRRNQLNKMIGNFVKFGNPTPIVDPFLDNVEWPKITDVDNMDYLNFGKQLTIETKPKDAHYKFWLDLYSANGQPNTTF